MPTPTRPKRGAPFGNTNHLKHGLYARLLQERALKAAAAQPILGLQPDVDLVSYLTRRIHHEAICAASAFPEEAENTFLLLLLARALSLATSAAPLPPAAPPTPRLYPPGAYPTHRSNLPLLLETAFAQHLTAFDPAEDNPEKDESPL